ncbi:MAG: SecY family transport protein, partial [Acidimicrobiales bacterium]|nr:SecY family transport protein [Acidimicrobiales bacterium]
MGELITQRGIGNGMSLLIFTSVVSTLPAQGSLVQAENGNVALIILILVAVALLVGIVFVEQGQRRIPVQFAKRVVGKRMYGGQSTYIPLKVNQSGVIPIIFASSVLYLPTLVATALPSTGFWGSIQEWVDGNLVDPTSPVYLAFFGLMIVGFAYFYTAISFDPAKQADTIRKQGGFIPGIRPGPQTERYLARILSRITFPGAMFIAAVALVPSILIAVTIGTDSSSGAGAGAGGFAFGGISLLIATGVALETMKQIDSQLMMRNYEGCSNCSPSVTETQDLRSGLPASKHRPRQSKA